MKSVEINSGIVGLTTLETRRRSRQDLIEEFKTLKGSEEIDGNLFFKRHVSNTRGHSLKLFKNSVYKDVLKHSFANKTWCNATHYTTSV